MPFYEYHHHNNPEFKTIFHRDHIERGRPFCPLHWHSAPELLYVTDGEITVNCDGLTDSFIPGEIAVIGANRLHQIISVTEEAVYYCLILDESVCFDFPGLTRKSVHRDAVGLFKSIICEMEDCGAFYREAVKGYSAALYSLLCRASTEADKREISAVSNKKIASVKAATQLMSERYQEALSLEGIAEALNINKYYLSHIFKEISGSTVTEHLNYIRCKNAGAMLKSGKYTVSEAAYGSGFSNLSYFSRIYKKTMGRLPNSELKRII